MTRTKLRARGRCAVPIAAFAIALASPASAAPSIYGKWKTDDGDAIVRVGPCGAKLCGWIERVLNPKAPENDIRNSDPEKRKRPLVGAPVLYGYSGGGAKWDHGHAYDPKAGRTYNSRLELLASGKLQVTGCVAFICQSKIWTRAN